MKITRKTVLPHPPTSRSRFQCKRYKRCNNKFLQRGIFFVARMKTHLLRKSTLILRFIVGFVKTGYCHYHMFTARCGTQTGAYGLTDIKPINQIGGSSPAPDGNRLEIFNVEVLISFIISRTSNDYLHRNKETTYILLLFIALHTFTVELHFLRSGFE